MYSSSRLLGVGGAVVNDVDKIEVEGAKAV
jgi:hypothetical protein